MVGTKRILEPFDIVGTCNARPTGSSRPVDRPLKVQSAARLGKSEAHLRLAWLYNAAGMKDKAAIEYEEFLKKKPDYSDRKRLEDYISTNLKRD